MKLLHVAVGSLLDRTEFFRNVKAEVLDSSQDRGKIPQYFLSGILELLSRKSGLIGEVNKGIPSFI